MALDCENFVLERIFEGDSSEKAQNMKNDFNKSLETHLANTKDPFAKKNLNYNFWAVIEYIIKKRVALLEPGQELAFTKFERYAIDYGYVSNNTIDQASGFDENNLDNVLTSTIKITPEFQVLTITSWLAKELRKFSGVYEYEKMNAEYEKLCAKIDLEKNEKDLLLKNKRSYLANLGGLVDKPTFIKAATLTQNIEQSTDICSLIKYKIQAGQALSKEERLELISLENIMGSTRKERSEALRDQQSINSDILKCEESLVIKERTILELITNKGKAKLDLEKFHEKSMNITNKQKETFISEKVAHVKLMCELMAKRNKLEPTPCLSAPLPEKLPNNVLLAIASFIEADPLVFKNKQVKLKGHPSLLFVPGCGNGVYSYDENALMYPYTPVKDYQEMVIAGLVLYRWDCDEDRLFRDSYNSLKPYKKMSFVDLQKSLIKDYTVHITRELKGYKIFDKELRDWFKFNVSPKKGEEKKIDIIEGEQEKKVINDAEALIVQQPESVETSGEQSSENVEITEIQTEISENQALTDETNKLNEPEKQADASGQTNLAEKKENISNAETNKSAEDTIKPPAAEILKPAPELKQQPSALNVAPKVNNVEKVTASNNLEKKIPQGFSPSGADNNVKTSVTSIKPEIPAVKLQLPVNAQDTDRKPVIGQYSGSQPAVVSSQTIDAESVLKLKEDIIKSISVEFSNLFTKRFDELKNAVKNEITEVLKKEISGISENLKNVSPVSFNEKESSATNISEISQTANVNESVNIVQPAGEPEIPVSENFQKSRQAIYDKMKSVLKVEDIDSKLKIVPSNEANKIDIKILNIDVFGTELEIILSNFGILSKLHRFTDLFKG